MNQPTIRSWQKYWFSYVYNCHIFFFSQKYSLIIIFDSSDKNLHFSSFLSEPEHRLSIKQKFVAGDVKRHGEADHSMGWKAKGSLRRDHLRRESIFWWLQLIRIKFLSKWKCSQVEIYWKEKPQVETTLSFEQLLNWERTWERGQEKWFQKKSGRHRSKTKQLFIWIKTEKT